MALMLSARIAGARSARSERTKSRSASLSGKCWNKTPMPAPSGRWSEAKAFEEASLSPTWTLTLELAVAIMVSLKARDRRHRATGSIDFLGKMERRSEARRVGQECVSQCRIRGLAVTDKKKKKNNNR